MTRSVIIDGVRYVPVVESHPTMEKIAIGLMASFWGNIDSKDLKEKMRGLTVSIRDDGRGEPIESVLDDIARALNAVS